MDTEGRVFSRHRGGTLKELTGNYSSTYPRVGIGNPPRMVRIHTLVLTTFVGPRPVGQGARHLNGDPTDNRLKNLAWGTQAENMADKITHGTMQTKLTREQVLEIRRRGEAGESARRIAKDYPVSNVMVSHILARRYWKEV